MATLASGCGDDMSTSAARPPVIVAVETQRCRQPNRFHGVGIVAAGDLVLTAGHTVEGHLRALTVDGIPARVVTIDRRRDLAILSVDVPGGNAPAMSPTLPDEAQLLSADGPRHVAIDRQVTLVVQHATDQATYRRDVVFFTPGVADGDSGSPIVDDAGRLVGVVIADQEGEGVAITAEEAFALIGTAAASDDLTWPDPPGTC